MAVTVVDSNGQVHEFKQATDVQGNAASARSEAARQLGFATREFLARQSEARVNIDGVPDPNGKFINAGRINTLRAAISSALPAVIVGIRRAEQTTGQLSINVGSDGFFISDEWPGSPGGPSIVELSPTPPTAPVVSPPAVTSQVGPADPPGNRPSDANVVPPSNATEPIIANPGVNGGGVGVRPTSPGGGTPPGSEPNGTPSGSSTGDPNGPSTPTTTSNGQNPNNTAVSEPPASSGGGGTAKPNDAAIVGDGKKPGGKGGNANLTTDLSKLVINPQDNPLDPFDSYTYNIALYMLTPKEYVKMLKNPLNPRSAKKILICRSGGVGNDGGKDFDVDFYIDDLKMKNMATSPSKMTTNTNAVDISFVVHEPRGITFIERLKEQAKEALEEEQSYIHTPYLLEIKFKGYDEFGKPVESIGKPKYIPIKITEMRFYIEEGGATYQCKAMPYHHDVFSNIRSFIPVNVQVKAGTVGDVLNGAVTSIATETTRIEDDSPDAASQVLLRKDVLGEKHIDLPTAVNNFFRSQTAPSRTYIDPKTKKKVTVEQEAGVSDFWKFDMPPDILNAKIITGRISALNSPQKTQKLYKQYGSTMKGKVELDASNKYFTVNKGTSLIQLINYLIVGSTYITAPLVDNIDKKKNTKENISSDPIQWFKVVPQITAFRGWDKKEGRYKFEITWTIQIEGIYYNDYPHAKKAKPKAEGVHKVYDYIFTGRNVHITNLRLDFQSAYYEAQQMGTGNPTNDKGPSTRSPMRKVVTSSTEGQTINDDSTINLKRAKDLMTSIMHDGVSMQELSMGIIGDPAFLPTGDSFWQPQGNGNKIYSSPFLPDGTINYDITPPYVQLNFKTPTGYDDISGLADPSDPQNKKYSSDEFNGIYQVFQVESTFTGGMFSQQMIAIKTKMQPINDSIGRSRSSLENSERAAIAGDINNLGQTLLLSANSGLAKITSLANSSITNIATNIIPQHLSGLTTEIQQGVAGVATEIGELVQRILPEQAGDNSDLLVDDPGLNALDQDDTDLGTTITNAEQLET
jgi:hypothetical protein